MCIGRDRSARIWAAAGLQVPAKKLRKLYRTHRPQPFAATAPNEVWAYDFVFDGCGNGQKLKCLTLIDEFTKESLAIDVAGTIRSTRVVKVLKEVIQRRGNPKGNPPVRSGLSEVEFSPMEEVLHEEVPF